MRTADLFAFIHERYRVYDRRRQGLGKPWTSDPILQTFRFCNVYREDDTQTIWFAQHWRKDHADAWFAALVFRLINWHETAEELGFPVPWDPARFVAILSARKAAGKKVWNGAYTISTHGVHEDKAPYLAKLLSAIWAQRADIRYQEGESLAAFHTRLMSCFGVGSFIAAQVIADCKYSGAMAHAPDWFSFAASGPGSRRGLNRVQGRPPGAPYPEADWRRDLACLYDQVVPLVRAAGMPDLHAQDLQNCLCEFDKYERVRTGAGRPRSRYAGTLA